MFASIASVRVAVVVNVIVTTEVPLFVTSADTPVAAAPLAFLNVISDAVTEIEVN